jgi:predicted nuclease of predicted toxin-antitoxin system
MSVAFYMDEHVPFAITTGLILRGVDVLTVQDDEHQKADDPVLLDRAMALKRVIFTQDEDFLREAQRRQTAGKAFAGVVYAHQLNVTIGQCVADLELIAKISVVSGLLNPLIIENKAPRSISTQ